MNQYNRYSLTKKVFIFIYYLTNIIWFHSDIFKKAIWFFSVLKISGPILSSAYDISHVWRQLQQSGNVVWSWNVVFCLPISHPSTRVNRHRLYARVYGWNALFFCSLALPSIDVQVFVRLCVFGCDYSCHIFCYCFTASFLLLFFTSSYSC